MPRFLTIFILLCALGFAACNLSSENSGENKQTTEKTESDLKKENPNPVKEKKKPKVKPAVKEKVPEPREPAPPKLSIPAVAKSDIKTLSDSDFVPTMLKLVNDQRKAGCVCGNKKYAPAKALKWNTSLQKIAHDHSIDMAQNQKMSHDGSNGSGVNDRLDAGGYAWRGYGENVAFGQRNIQQVFESWIKSPSHCKNIMNPDMKEVGVEQEAYYWTMVLAIPNQPLM